MQPALARTQRAATRRRRAPPARQQPRSARTRARLLETAGQLFAEQGIDRVTGQQICRRAGVHAAAIVYHFGGLDGLQRAVLMEAQQRLVSTEALVAAVSSQHEPRAQLRAFLGAIVERLTTPASRSWAARLFSREFIAPSLAYGRAHDELLAERAQLLRGIVAALTGLPPRHPSVARACISIMAPCAVLLLFNRRKLARLLPELALSGEAAGPLVDHLVGFALEGLGGIATRAVAGN